MDDKDKVKTSQPHSEDVADTTFQGMTGGEPKQRPDAVDDPKKKAESGKTTQRQE